MSYNIIITPAFKKAVKEISKKHRSLKNDLSELFASLEQNPIQGTPLGKECYKIRLAITSKGKGKSGGARVITCVKVINQNVFMLTVYDKSDKENISANEIAELLKFINH